MEITTNRLMISNLEDIRLATELRMVHKNLMNEVNKKYLCLDSMPCVDINYELGLDPGHLIAGIIFFYNKLKEGNEN